MTSSEAHARKVAYNKEYRQRNKEKIAAKGREYYLQNKEASNARSREYYLQNKESVNARAKVWAEENPKSRASSSKKISDRNYAVIVEAKSVPCRDCGQSVPPCAMDLHHRDETTKLFSLGDRGSHALKKIEAEIAKCEVICANCHRIRHHATIEEPPMRKTP